MRLALLADVHANLPALEAVLEAVEAERTARVLCLGDVVGYNAHPAEVIRLLRSRADVAVVAGNHDRDVLQPPTPGTSSAARQVSAWTRSRLDDSSLSWLEALPNRVLDPRFVGVHGCYLNDAHVTGYVTDTMLERNLRAVAARSYPRLAFCGHTHLPLMGVLRAGEAITLPLSTEARYQADDEVVLLNPGSVGQPRDGDPRASFALVDLDARTVTLRRVPYDVERTAAAILAEGLPRSLAERLVEGR